MPTYEAAPDAALPQPQQARSPAWADGLPMLMALTGWAESTARPKLGKLLKEARNDGARVLAVIRDAMNERPADAMSWIIPRLNAQTKEPLDPADRWGIGEWCRSIGAQPYDDPEKRGSWTYGGKIIDNVARKVARAAGWGSGSRPDWSLLRDWIDAGVNSQDILAVVERVTARMTANNNPPRSLRVFHNDVMMHAKKPMRVSGERRRMA